MESGHHRALGLSSLARGLELLSLALEQDPVSATSLASRSGVPLSSTYRYLATLTASGFLEEADGLYGPGRQLARAGRAEGLEQMGKLARPLLRSLVDSTAETALLTVRLGTAGLILERVESPHFVRLSFEEGTLRPLYAGASVKILLAYAPEDLVTDVIKGGLAPFTERTPDESTLRAQLAQVRKEGYALSHGEVDEHAFAVGVPVYRDEECVAALSLAAPEQRFSPEKASSYLDLVREAGRTLSEALTRLDGRGGGRGTGSSPARGSGRRTEARKRWAR